MTEHEMLDDIITAASLQDKMATRFCLMLDNDRFNGRYAGEIELLETVLADEITEDEGSLCCDKEVAEQLPMDSVPSVPAAFCEQESGLRGGVSRPVAGTASLPRLLTGGSPRTDTPESPLLPSAEVPEFSHGGYDGGIKIGFEGDWNWRFSDLLETLDKAKEAAEEACREGKEGEIINLAGESVLVLPTGGKAGDNGGLRYKHRFICRGVEFLIHANPRKHIQPVRVRYLAESLIGSDFFTVHEQFVLPFLRRLGLVVHADKPSRIDMQVMIDVPMDEFAFLFTNGHVVTNLRNKSMHWNGKNVNTITLGSISNLQIQCYNKRAELQANKSDVVKKALFIQHNVGDEWYNSNRPITRVEIRLHRDALRCLGVDTVADLKKVDGGIVDLITSRWFRILKNPKVRGHENTAEIHPVWERVRGLFMTYFTGAEKAVEWDNDRSVNCDPAALEKQALR